MFEYHVILLLIATANSALVAGLFYSWSCGITQGLGKLGDEEYIKAMQSINKAIQRPWFFMSFMGTLVLLPLAAWAYNGHGQPAIFNYLVAASVLYAVGVFGITVVGNVPLNNMLENYTDLSPTTDAGLAGNPSLASSRTTITFVDTGSPQAGRGSAIRTAFESRWNRLNNIRTFCAIAALICAILACIAS
jgi:uncharacterized membrane protein